MDVMTENKVEPKLRFGEFKDNWNNHLLDDIATFLKGKGISKSELDDDGKTECIRYGELYVYYNELIDEVKSKTNLENLVLSKANDVIIPASGETQLDIATASCVLRSGIALGGDLNVIRTENNGLFLSYYLNSKKKFEIARLSQGSSVVHLYASQLKTLKLNLPILPEQQKIASFLSAVDEKLQQLTKKKELLEEYKKGLMQQIFSQELRFKDANGNNYPDWEEKKLEEVFENIGGTALENHFSDKGEYFVISIGNYGVDGKYNDNGQRIVLNEKTKTKLLDKDNLVMVLNDKTKTGDIIGSTILIDEENKYIYNQRSERLICETTIITPLYAWTFLNSKQFRRLVFSISQGGTQIYVNFSAVKKLKSPIPCIEEQCKIANFFSAIDGKIELVSTQIENTKAFKKGLLQQMFV